MEFNGEYSRRQFLELSGLLTTGLLSSCVSPTSRPTVPTRNKIVETLLPARVLFDSAVNEIKNPIIKRYLLDDIGPLYETPGLRMIDYGGHHLRVEPASIHLQTSISPDIAGEYDTQAGLASIEYSIVVPQQRLFPLAGILKPEELNIFPRLGSYGFSRVNFGPSLKFKPGMVPKITLSTYDRRYLNDEQRERHDNTAIFVFAKELCTHVLFNYYISETIRILAETDQPVTVEALTQDGEKTEVEFITQAIGNFMRRHGRLQAGLDLGGLILTINSLRGSRLSGAANGSTFNSNFDANPFIKYVESKDLGTTGRDIYNNVMEVVLTRPDARNFFHYGNLDVVP